MNKYTPEEPIAAIATALVPSAIGIVRTSGKNCIELVSKIFSRKKALLQAAGNSLVYGWIQEFKTETKRLMKSCLVFTKLQSLLQAKTWLKYFAMAE